MASLTLRSVKSAPLTNSEVDANFTSLNTDIGTRLLASNNLSDLTNAATARSNLGLGNVENKSSATIRGELTSSNVTTALGFTPLSNATSYLPLSGGTITGDLFVQGNGSRLSSHFFHYEYDAGGSVYEHFYAPGSENVKNSSANLRVASTSGYYKTLFFSGDGTFQWNSNTVLHAGNYSSYALPLSGGTVSGAIYAPTFQTTGATGAQGNLGSISSSWAGTAYPTLYSTASDRWVMHINPHISYTQNGVNGFTGSMTGATIRYAADPGAGTYWDAGVGTNGVGADTWSIGRAGSNFLKIDNGGTLYVGTSGYVALHAGNYTNYTPSRSEFRNFGSIYINPNGDNATCTTAQFIAHLTSLGFFNYSSAVCKTVWSYASNNDLTDTGFGTVELAGCVIETFANGDGTKHVRVTRPTTGTGGFQVLVYVDQGSSYSPGWRQLVTSEGGTYKNLSAGGLYSRYNYNESTYISDATSAYSLSPDYGQTTVAMHTGHGSFGDWATTLTMSGYERYGAYQISGWYNATTPTLAIRNYNQSLGGWTSWVRMLSSANYSSYALPLSGGTVSGTVRINSQLQVGQNTNGTAYIDAYGGIARFGRDSTTNGLLLDGNNIATIQTAFGNVTIGPANSSWCHFQTDRPRFYFGSSVSVNGDIQRYSDSATYLHTSNAPRAANSDVMYYAGFTLNANDMPANSTGFTYGNNAPYTGPVVRFSTGGGYDLWLNAPYSGGGAGLRFRTRNGDAGTFNSWYDVVHSGNYTSYSAPVAYTVQGEQARGRSTYSSDMNSLSDPSGFYFYPAPNGSPTGEWTTWINAIGGYWSAPDGYGFQLANSFWNDSLWVRRLQNGTWQSWNKILHSSNYSSYALPLSGGTVSGSTRFNSALVMGGYSNSNSYIAFNNAGQYWGLIGNYGTNDWRLAYGPQDSIAGWALSWDASGNVGVNGALTQGGNQVLHAGNFTNYAPGSFSSWSFTDVYASNWLRNYNSKTGLYNQATGNHWYSDGGFWNVAYSGTNGIRLRNGHDGTIMGYLYGETDGNFGLLHNGGGWAVQVYPGGGGYLHGTWNGANLRATRANGNFYIDDNYGCGVVGAYSSYRYQGVFAMGDSYKLPADGTTTGSLYGMAWAHPNAGGVAGNLDSHGMIVMINGGFGSCMSYSIKASGNVTAYSDERLKTNWRDMPENFVARLARVKVGIYDRIDGDKLTQVGVGAQSFRELLPEAITTATDDMGTLSVSYGNAALASAVELAKDNVELRARVERLEALINRLIGD